MGSPTKLFEQDCYDKNSKNSPIQKYLATVLKFHTKQMFVVKLQKLKKSSGI